MLEERDGANSLIVSYTYGDDLIRQNAAAPFRIPLRRPDEHTELTDALQSVSDTYNYDVFGVLLNSSGSTPNNYMYTGEQLDANIGFYYLRARYYIEAAGRFSTTDSVEGFTLNPMTLHKYIYGNSNPANNVDLSAMTLSTLLWR